MNKCRLVMLMLFVSKVCVTFVLELFPDIHVEKRYFLSFYILGLDDFIKAGIFSLTTDAETLFFDFRLYAGVLVSFGYFFILCIIGDVIIEIVLFLFQLRQLLK